MKKDDRMKDGVYGQPEIEEGSIPLNEDTYSLAHFYVRATDVHHNKTTVKMFDKTIAVPPYMAALINEMVSSELTPYRTAYDFIRDAIVHRVYFLQEEMGKTSSATFGRFEEMAEIERMASQAEEQQAQVDRIKSLMDTALHQRDSVLLQAIRGRAEKLVVKLRPPFKDELREYLAGWDTIAAMPKRSAT